MSSGPMQTYYVIMPPQPPDTGSAIRPLTRLLHEDEEKVRARLLCKTYQVLQRFAKKPNAEGLVGQLNALGVQSFAVSDQGIRGALFVWCRSANKGAGGFALKDFNDQPFYCPFNDIANVSILRAEGEHGYHTKFIDLHRRSTPIIPRLDTAMFDFAKLVNRDGAGIEDFLDELEQNAELKVDREHPKNSESVLTLAKDFASAPSMFAPDPDLLQVPYVTEPLRAANLYSFLARVHRVEGAVVG